MVNVFDKIRIRLPASGGAFGRAIFSARDF
jgi:hypothetical protein